MDGTEWRTEETQVLERVAATFREEFTDLSKLVRASTKEEGGETRRTDSVGVKYQGEARGRGGGKARDGSGHGKRYRASWNRGNEPDIDRVDRAYSPRLYVRLFAEK